MDAERWRLLQELFAAAVELPEAERRKYLDRRCGGDVALRNDVEKLLSADTAGPGPVGAAVLDAARESVATIPERLGPYRIVRELGRGGMGEVHLAERDDGQFEQRVAVKIVSWGRPNSRIVERFLAERRILARLEHPFIARLVDGGSTDSGRPYFVMEYVDGEPIDVHCDRKRLSVRRRLELFRMICSAVDTAHRNLIVHRDLKPSNILVTEDGTPKMLDFGIAKLLESDDDASVSFTTRGERAMTPEYASPEQVRHEPVSTATDVYALGLLLYELLAGRRAQNVDSDRPQDIERAVCTTTPPRPSEAVARDETGQVARHRSTTAARLEKALAGDLDKIVLMALRKEPKRRYGSVSELSEDVRRYLEGRPVHAHADSWTYRLGKFVNRHRIPVAAAAVVVLAIVAGVGGTLWQARRAIREARRAQDVSNFLVNLLEVTDPETSQGRDVTVREVLDVASARTRTELGSQPEQQAALQALLGRLYLQLGDYERAWTQAQASLERRRRLFDADDPAVAESTLLAAEVLVERGEPEKAESEVRRVLDEQRRARGGELAIAESWSVLGEILEKEGNYKDAREALMEAAALQRRHPEARASVGQTLYRHAFVEVQDGKFDEAERLYREALAIARSEAEGSRSLSVARNLRGLALTLVLAGRSSEDAEAMMTDALSITRELLGDDHPEIATFLNGLAIVRDRAGDFEGAEEAYLESYHLIESTLGPDHPLLGTIWNNLGVLRHRQERYLEAADYYGRSVAFRKRVLGPDHPLVGTTMSFQAYALQRAGQPEAEPLFREALDQLLRIRGPEHPHVASAYNDLGRLLLDTDRFDEAETMLQKAVDIRRATFGERNARSVTASMNLGAARCGRGTEDGVERLEGARAVRREVFGDDAWQVVEANLLLAQCLGRLGRREEALELLAPSRTRVKAGKGPDHWLTRLSRRVSEGLGSH